MRRTNYLKLSVSVVLVLIIYLALVAALVRLESDEPHTTIRNFSDGVWFLIATLTTVGYGDKFPVTTEGRIIAAILMTTGVGLFGTFTAFIASWFVEEKRHESQ